MCGRVFLQVVSFEYLPAKTVNAKGHKTVWVRCSGNEKKRVTAMLMGDSSGVAYTPFLVMKSPPAIDDARDLTNLQERQGFGPYVWLQVPKIEKASGVKIYGNRTAWWNAHLSKTFLEPYFASRPDLNKPVLLLLDGFAGHWTADVISYATSINVTLMKVPPRHTAVCQPTDVAWNRPFKSYLRDA